MKLERGTVVLVELDPALGHEQRGVRPCIAVSDPAVNADRRQYLGEMVWNRTQNCNSTFFIISNPFHLLRLFLLTR